MRAEALFSAFYAELDRDLIVYMIVLAIAAALTAIASRFVHKRTLTAAALFLIVAGGGLVAAAQNFRLGIAAKHKAEVVAYRAEGEAAIQTLIDKRGPRSTPHFQMLALIWTTLSGIGLLAMILFRRPIVSGIGGALIFLSMVTFILDLQSHRRDLRFAALASKELKGTR